MLITVAGPCYLNPLGLLCHFQLNDGVHQELLEDVPKIPSSVGMPSGRWIQSAISAISHRRTVGPWRNVTSPEGYHSTMGLQLCKTNSAGNPRTCQRFWPAHRCAADRAATSQSEPNLKQDMERTTLSQLLVEKQLLSIICVCVYVYKEMYIYIIVYTYKYIEIGCIHLINYMGKTNLSICIHCMRTLSSKSISSLELCLLWRS